MVSEAVTCFVCFLAHASGSDRLLIFLFEIWPNRMLNQHDFQNAARQFRAGRISLNQFTDRVFGKEKVVALPNETLSKKNPSKSSGPAKFAMPVRPVDAHKGDFGRVLLIGGCETMPGSIAMASLASLRSGSGLVVTVTPDDAELAVASLSPCPMVISTESKDGLFAKSAIDDIDERADWADVLALGPGMGRSKACQKISKHVYQKFAQPIVVDADGLNNLADAECDLSAHEGMRVLTPHPGEFRRLTGTDTSDRTEMESEAIEFAAKNKVTIVLKGPHTLVTDGTTTHRNESGNSGMATAGSGDVLTGVITSLLGQGLTPIDAATTACYIHGLAGDLAAEKFGELSMIATDILTELPNAFKSIAS